MIATPPFLGDQAAVMPRADGGYWVVPYVLPIDVPHGVLTLTVGEWLGVDRE